MKKIIYSLAFFFCAMNAMHHQIHIEDQSPLRTAKHEQIKKHCTEYNIPIKNGGCGCEVALIPKKPLLLTPRFERGENGAIEFTSLYHILTGKRVCDLKDHGQDFLSGMAVNNAGTQAAIAHLNGGATLWDLEKQQPIISFKYHDAQDTMASNVYFSPDEKEIWVNFPGYTAQEHNKPAYYKGFIERYDINTGQYIGLYKQDFLNLSPDRSCGVQRVARNNNKVEFIIEEVRNGKRLGSFTMDNHVFNEPTFSPDNKTMSIFDSVALEKDSFWVKVVNFIQGKQESAWTNHKSVGNTIFDPSGNYLFVASNDETADNINVFDIKTGEKYKDLAMKTKGAVILDSAQQSLDINDDYFAASILTHKGTMVSVWEDHLKEDNKKNE